MTTMLRQMAATFQADLREQRVLYEFDPAHPDPQRLMMFTGETADLTRALRAALEAIRDIPPDMAAEAYGAGGISDHGGGERADPAEEFGFMIDAILNEKPEAAAPE